MRSGKGLIGSRHDPNTHSTGTAAGLTALATAVDELAAQDRTGLSDAARAERVLGLRRLLDRLEGLWLQELAAVDARGAAGADQDQPAASTAGWLRSRLHMGAGAATSSVRTARALYRGPLPETGQALADGKLSPAHAQVLGPRHPRPARPHHRRGRTGPAGGRPPAGPPRLRRVVSHLRWVADPDTAEGRAEQQHQRRGLWLDPTLEGMVAVDGLLEPEAGQTVLAALEPLARPTSPAHPSDAPTPWPSWPAAPWRPAGCRTRVGSGPS